ncbi:MAG: phosphate-binding protein [Ignavibacteriaceae bacterium]|nr:MAG: phosphate-binding protein [Ignavibacteriaceae bacterium]
MLASLFIIFLLFSGCGDERRGATIYLKGSDTMVNLCQKWVEAYMRQNDSVTIMITGGGSGNGITALLNGSADIACVSRELFPAELERAKVKHITLSTSTVALDGISVIVNEAAGISELSVDELKGIFTGRIKNFREVGGADLPVSLYGRESNSGTFAYFRENILDGEDFSRSTHVLQGTAALAEAVSNDKRGIAYGSVGYFIDKPGLHIIRVKTPGTETSISPVDSNHPNYEDIRTGRYLISRKLNFILRDTPGKATADFIQFVLSAEGQKIAEEMKFIPLN